MDLSDSWALGSIYAMVRHRDDTLRDERAAEYQARQDQQQVQAAQAAEPNETPWGTAYPEPANVEMVGDWSEFIGQESLKRTLNVYMTKAQELDEPLPHILLASGSPGIGKSHLARLIAKSMKRDLYEIVPPFTVETLASVLDEMWHTDLLFCDEIHRMAIGRSRSAEMLLKVLEENKLPLPDGTMMNVPKITVIGATTDPDLLPEPVLDRFKIKPAFVPYTISELAQIALHTAYKESLEAGDRLSDDLAISMAYACRGTPRILGEMVMGADALFHVYGRPPTSQELFDFLQVEPDGLTRQHVNYLMALYRHFGRRNPMGKVEYVAGEGAMQGLLRETKPGINRLERYLQEVGMVERTQRGRKLTDMGLLRVKTLIDDGKG